MADIGRRAGSHALNLGTHASEAEMAAALRQLQSRTARLEAVARSSAQGSRLTGAINSLLGLLSGLACGGLAGVTARTVVAPIDRVKILMQTSAVIHPEASAAGRGGAGAQYRGIWQTMTKVMAEQGGVRALWKSNGVNCLKVAPHSALQLASFDVYKRRLLDRPANASKNSLTIPERLLCGSLAGMTAASFTHPIDVLRVRLAVSDVPAQTLRGVARESWADGGLRSLYRGYGATLLSVTPFIALNFTTFDALKTWHKETFPDARPSPLPTLAMGACAGLTAQTICFPLDTVRRRMQLRQSQALYNGIGHAFKTIVATEGVAGLYKGMAPNAMKLVPQNGIRFLAYDTLKELHARFQARND